MHASTPAPLQGLEPLLEATRRWVPKSGSVGRQASLVVLGDGITFLTVFATAMILTRVIDKADMGTFRQVMFLCPLATAIVEFGIPAAAYRFLPLYHGAQRVAFLWAALGGTGTLAIVASLALGAAAIPLARAFENDQLGFALLICAGYPLATMPFTLVRPLLLCGGHSLKATLLETVLSLIAALAVIVPLYMGNSLNQALLWWMGANALKLPVAGWYLLGGLSGERLTWDCPTAREVWEYVWPIQVGQLPNLVLNNFDKALASLLLPTPVFASYSLGARPLPFLNAIPISISSVAVPRMVGDLRSGQGDFACMMWRKSCLAAALVSYPFAAFSIWNAKDIVSLLFTAAYTEAAIPFAFFAGITFLQVVDYAGLARAMGDSRIIMRSAMLAMSVSVCSTLILALLWGIWGISASLLLSTAFVAVFYVVHYQRTLRRPVGHFFPQWPLLCVGGLAFSAAVVARAAQGLLWSPAGSSFVVQAGKLGLSLAICLGVYVAGLLAVRTLRSSFARSTHVEIAGPGVVGDPASSVKAQGRNGSGSTTPASGE